MAQLSVRGRRASTPKQSGRRRGWLSTGVATLTVSALSLAVAGSIALTSNAQTSAFAVVTATSQPRTDPAEPRPVPRPPQPGGGPSAAEATPSSFTGRDTERPSRSDPGRAEVAERAAARAESLSKTAADITRAARDGSSARRSKSLQARDRAARENAVRIAERARTRAVAARLEAQQLAAAERLAAVEERTAAEAAARPAAVNAEESAAASSVPQAPPDANQAGPAASGPAPPPVPQPPQTSTGSASSPVPGAPIGAHFGEYGLWSRWHTGVDFRAAHGMPIKAVKSGVVLYAGNSGNWSGNRVAVKHNDGMTTMSSHMSSMAVSAGQSVQAGQVIGYVGQTGRAFGAHLHFELYPAGVRYGDVYSAINPQPWLSASGVETR